jgi:A118 family predicted phage portal protein
MQLPATISEYIVKNAYAELPDLTFKANKTVNEDGEEQNDDARSEVLSKELDMIQEILKANNFTELEKDLFETQLPIGDRVIKPYVDKGKIKINYITGDRFYETRVENYEIISGIFLTTKKFEEGNKTFFFTRVEWHYRLDETLTREEIANGIEKTGRGIKVEVYKTQNVNNLFKSYCKSWQDDLFNVFGELREEQHEEYPNLEVPTFVFSKNPIKNKKDIQSARGLGIFMMQLSMIQSVDEAINSKSTDNVYGSMKIKVPDSASEKVMDSDGREFNHYNPTDPEIFVYESTMGESPEAIAPTLRTEQHVLSMNTDIDIVTVGVGVTAGTLRFDGKSIVTATQFVSEKSETGRTVMMHENNNTDIYKRVLMLIKFYAKEFNIFNFTFEENEIDLIWHDNVRIDDESKREEQRTLVREGYKSRQQYLEEQEGMEAEDAKESVMAAVREQAEIENTLNEVRFGDNEDLDESDPDGTNNDNEEDDNTEEDNE